MTLESATLKETPLVDGRIAIVEHSPNACRVRLNAASEPTRGRRFGFGGQIITSPAKLIQTKLLGFAWFYSFESGLFSGLRRNPN
jgi:hypothetical protein